MKDSGGEEIMEVAGDTTGESSTVGMNSATGLVIVEDHHQTVEVMGIKGLTMLETMVVV